MGNVSYVNTNLNATIIQVLEVDGIVELFAAVGIYGEGFFIPEVATALQGLFAVVGNRPVFEADILDDGIREIIWPEVVVAQESISLHLKVTHDSKLLNKSTERM